MNNKTIKVLIVDDSVIFRKILEETVSEINNAEVIGSVFSGKKHCGNRLRGNRIFRLIPRLYLWLVVFVS